MSLSKSKNYFVSKPEAFLRARPGGRKIKNPPRALMRSNDSSSRLMILHRNRKKSRRKIFPEHLLQTVTVKVMARKPLARCRKSRVLQPN